MKNQTLSMTITVEQRDTGKVTIRMPDAPDNFPVMIVLNPEGCSTAYAKKCLKKHFGDFANLLDIQWDDYAQAHKNYQDTLTYMVNQAKKS